MIQWTLVYSVIHKLRRLFVVAASSSSISVSWSGRLLLLSFPSNSPSYKSSIVSSKIGAAGVSALFALLVESNQKWLI